MGVRVPNIEIQLQPGRDVPGLIELRPKKNRLIYGISLSKIRQTLSIYYLDWQPKVPLGWNLFALSFFYLFLHLNRGRDSFRFK
jgi:hypothetical protein